MPGHNDYYYSKFVGIRCRGFVYFTFLLLMADMQHFFCTIWLQIKMILVKRERRRVLERVSHFIANAVCVYEFMCAHVHLREQRTPQIQNDALKHFEGDVLLDLMDA